MQITTLLGSARKKGNTATVLGWVEEEFKSLGHDVERIYLNNKSIRGCLGCIKCQENPDEIACVQKDDAIDIMEQMVASDAVLYAAPIYFWGFPAQMKALIDRGYALVTNYNKPEWTSLMEGTRMGLLVTGEVQYVQNAEDMFAAFDRLVGYYLAKKSGELYVGGCGIRPGLPKGVKGTSLELARSMVD